MFGIPKRPLEPLNAHAERDRRSFLFKHSQPDDTLSPPKYYAQRVFADERNRKRDYYEFQHDQDARIQLEAQLQQPRIHTTGETWTPPKGINDPDASMTDAPPIPHVHYTPPVGWRPPASAHKPPFRKSILKRRMQPYDALPYDYTPDKPFEYDLSGYIEERDHLDAVNGEYQRAQYEGEQQRHGGEQQRGQYEEEQQRRAQYEEEQQQRAQYEKEQQQHAQDEREQRLQRYRDAFSQVRAHRRDPDLAKVDHPPHLWLANHHQASSPQRKIHTLVPRRTSPPQQLFPPRPSATELYPHLRNEQLQLSTPIPEETPVRRIGGMFVGVLSYVPQFFVWGYRALFGTQQVQQQEIVAIETNNSGRKRRAVAAGDVEHTTPPPQAGDIDMMDAMPGHFPGSEPIPETSKQKARQQQHTPPDSRPGSKGAEVAGDLAQTSRNTKGQSTRQPKEQTAEQQTQIETQAQAKLRQWQPTRQRKALHLTTKEEILQAQVDAIRLSEDMRAKIPSKKDKLSVPMVNPLPSDARRPISDRSKFNKDRDTSIDQLLNKTQRITLASRIDSQSFRQSRTRKERSSLEEQQCLFREEPPSKPDFKEQARREVEEQNEDYRRLMDADEAEAAVLAEMEAARAKAMAEEKNKLIRPLDEDWDERVRAATSHPNPKTIVAKTIGGAEISSSDMSRLWSPDPRRGGTGKWLNDVTVNAIMEAIIARNHEKTGYVKGPKNAAEMAAFHSGWLNTYNSRGITGIKTWSRRLGVQGDKLLRAKKIFFPINTSQHWFLMVISPQDRDIEVLDSLSGHPHEYFQIAHEWLQMELGKDYNASEWTETVDRSSQQANMNDCGVFTCLNALVTAKERDPSEILAGEMKLARAMLVAVLLNGGFHDDWEL